MTAKEQYAKSYRDLSAFLVLACRASNQSLDLCKRLLNELCTSAIEYGRTTKHVLDDLYTAAEYPTD